ncbi:MAG: hypothetical protein D3923_12915 [Candidatus Electrothrix sp. AR3]|nr:hypothetical protein [Candidatus Electrothrix sp. AR3]
MLQGMKSRTMQFALVLGLTAFMGTVSNVNAQGVQVDKNAIRQIVMAAQAKLEAQRYKGKEEIKFVTDKMAKKLPLHTEMDKAMPAMMQKVMMPKMKPVTKPNTMPQIIQHIRTTNTN